MKICSFECEKMGDFKSVFKEFKEKKKAFKRIKECVAVCISILVPPKGLRAAVVVTVGTVETRQRRCAKKSSGGVRRSEVKSERSTKVRSRCCFSARG